jgi:hypothetical protein
MSTDISPAFKFVEWRRFVCNEEKEKSWTPDVVKSSQIPEHAPHQEIAAKWVYVFQEHSKGSVWIGEYFVDGLIYPVDLTQCRNLERSQRPRSKNGSTAISLAHTINNLTVTYYTYISRIQLPLKFVQELESRAAELLLHVNVAYCNPPDDYPKVHQLYYDGNWLYRAVDPLTVALHLAAEYRDAADDLIGYTTLYDGQPQGQARQVTRRRNKVLIAQTLVGLLESDPGDNLDLRGNFSATGKQDMYDFLADDTATWEAKTSERNRRAAQLCFWISGKLFDFAKRAHFANQSDIPGYINAIGQSVHRLQESPAGQALIARWVLDDGHWIHTYIVPQSAVAENVFQVGRKCGNAIATIWAETPNVFIGIYPRDRAAALLTLGWSNITRIDGDEMLVEITTKRGTILTLEKGYVAARVEQVAVNTNRSKLASWVTWIGDGPDAPRVEKVMKTVLGAVEVLNFALSAKAVYEAGLMPTNKDSAMALIGMLGSTTDLGLFFASEAIKQSFKKALPSSVASPPPSTSSAAPYLWRMPLSSTTTPP